MTADPEMNARYPGRDPAAVASFLALDDGVAPRTADVAFVFGTRHRNPADIAARLHRDGVVTWVVLTGGQNPLTGLREARVHEEILRRSGAPMHKVVVDDVSRNTLENVLEGVSKLRSVVELDRLVAVAVVAKWFHCRRAAMTLRRHLPAGVRYYPCTYDPPDLPRDGWHLDPDRRTRVLGEIDRIARYLERDHLAELEFREGAYV